MYEGPCTQCIYKTTCVAYPELLGDLYKDTSFQAGSPLDEDDRLLDTISRLWVRTVALCGGSWPQEERQASLPALFDLLCSAFYAREAALEGLHQKPALRCADELIFPFTWMCPRCVKRGRALSACYLPDAERKKDKRGKAKDYPQVSLLAKPGARLIGDVGFKVLMSLLRVILKSWNALGSMDDHYQLTAGGGKRGEFDLTLASDKELVFGEVKAKPLIAFPLILQGYFQGDSSHAHEWTRSYVATRSLEPISRSM